MKIKYFQDTDTLYIEFKSTLVSESRDLDENTLLGPGCGWKCVRHYSWHARDRADIPKFSLSRSRLKRF